MADVSDYWNWLPAVNSGAAMYEGRQNRALRERESLAREETERQRLAREAARDARLTAYQERLLAAQEAEAGFRQQQLQQRQAPVVPVEMKVGGRTFLYNPLSGVPTPVDPPQAQAPVVPGEVEIGGQKFIYNPRSGNFQPLDIAPNLRPAVDQSTGASIPDLWMTPRGSVVNTRRSGGGLDFSELFNRGPVSTRPTNAPVAPPPVEMPLLPETQRAVTRKVFNPKTGRVE